MRGVGTGNGESKSSCQYDGSNVRTSKRADFFPRWEQRTRPAEAQLIGSTKIMTQVGSFAPAASRPGLLTCVFDSELDSEIIGTVANDADGVFHEPILSRLPLLPKEAIRCDENNLQRCRRDILHRVGFARARVEGSGGMGREKNNETQCQSVNEH